MGESHHSLYIHSVISMNFVNAISRFRAIMGWGTLSFLIGLFPIQAQQTSSQSIESMIAAGELFKNLPQTADLIREWSKSDPQSTATKIEQSFTGKHRMMGLQLVMTIWGETAPDRAIAWLNNISQFEANMLLPLIISGWAKTNPIEAAAFIEENTTGQTLSISTQTLMRSWAQSNADEAILWANRLAPGPLRTTAKRSIINSIEEESVSLITKLLDSKAPSEIHHLVNGAFPRLSTVDPNLALEIAKQLPRGDTRNHAISLVLAALAISDPEEALALLDTLNDSPIKEEIFLKIFPALALQNPDQALDILQRITSETFRHRATAKAASAIAIHDPRLAAMLATSLPAGNHLNSVIKIIAPILAMESVPETLEWISVIPTDVGKNAALSAATKTLAQSDPYLAAELATELPSGLERTVAFDQIADVLSASGIPAALHWANGLTPRETRLKSIVKILRNWLVQDPPATALYIKSQIDEDMRTEVVDFIGNQLAWHDQDSTLQLIRGIQPESAKITLMERMMTTVAGKSYEDGLSILNQFSDPTLRTAGVIGLVSGWGAQDPRSTGEWLASQTPSPGLGPAYEVLLENWSRSNSASAITWGQSLPSPEYRDHAYAGLSKGFAIQHPNDALDWANQINDQTLKNRVVAEIALLLMRFNPSSARSWIQSIDLPADTKTQLLNSDG